MPNGDKSMEAGSIEVAERKKCLRMSPGRHDKLS